MSLRRRLLVLFALTVVVSVAAVTWIVSAMARRAFDRANDERTAALVAQFRREFSRRGEDVSRRIQAITAISEATRMVVAASQAAPNYSVFLDDAQTVAEAQRLDFLEFADDRGTIISSAQWPAKFGYKEPLAAPDSTSSPFLKEEDTPAGSSLGLFAIRTVAAGEHRLYLIGGIRLDKSFLASLDLPAGMRLMLYENLDHGTNAFSASRLISADDSLRNPEELKPLVQQIQRDARESGAIIHWNSDNEEMVNGFPLAGENNQLLGILLVGSSRQIYAELRGQIRSAALLAAAAGLLLAVLLSSWAAARVTKPVEKLAHAAHEIAGGNWNARVTVNSNDEIGELADSFNRMTRDLLDQRERLVQAERVAAWRELARRLAHELKNPLFPLQLTVENMLRAKASNPSQFEEVFQESAETLLAEIANLKTIIGRFSDFSKMPAPQLQAVDLNELVRSVAQLFQGQFNRDPGRIQPKLQLGDAPQVSADPVLLRRVIE